MSHHCRVFVLFLEIARNTTSDFIRTLASQPFRILVGSRKRGITMHSAVLARQSPRLTALVEGNMRGAEESTTDWSRWDEDTFLRFCSFAYTGTYDVHVPWPATTLCNQRGRLRQMAKRNKTWTDWREFRSMRSDHMSDSLHHPCSCRPLLDQFFGHASVCVFAHYYSIEGLERRAMDDLIEELFHFDICPETSDDFMPFLRVCYENKTTAKLRQVAAYRAALDIDVLWEMPDFRELYVANEDMPTRIMPYLLKRIVQPS